MGVRLGPAKLGQHRSSSDLDVNVRRTLPLVVSFGLGMASSAWLATAWSGTATHDVVWMMQLGEVANERDRCQQAYRKEEAAVAIWALNHYVDLLQSLEGRPGKPSQRSLDVRFELLLAHARLAKLYRDRHHMEASDEHAVKALSYVDDRFKDRIVNREELFRFLGRIDETIERD